MTDLPNQRRSAVPLNEPKPPKGQVVLMPKIQSDKLLITQKNTLATAAYKMTLQEKRLLALTMAHVRVKDNDFKCYHIPVTVIKECLELKGKIHAEIQNVAEKLLSRVVKIENKNGRWKAFQWVSYCEYVPKEESANGKAYLEIQLHDHLIPMLLNLRKYFGSIHLRQVLPMSSVHSIRIFEILSCLNMMFTKTKIEIPVNDLKKWLGMESKYTNFKDFRRRVLEIAKRECEKHTNLIFTWEEEKKGRKIAILHFTVKRNPRFKNEPLPTSNIEQSELGLQSALFIEEMTTNEQNQVLSILKENGINGTTAESLLKDFSLQQIIENIELAREKHKNGKTKDLAATTVAAIRENWSNETVSPIERQEEEKKRQMQAANEQKEKQLKKLESTFLKEHRQRVNKIITNWDEETLRLELEEFEKTTDRVTRGRYEKYGLKSRLAKAAFIKHVGKKYLSPAENDFITWAQEHNKLDSE
jgi:plasmid replication initiation protein